MSLSWVASSRFETMAGFVTLRDSLLADLGAALGRCATQRHLQARIVAHPLRRRRPLDKRQIVIFWGLAPLLLPHSGAIVHRKAAMARDRENIFAGAAGQSAARIL